MSAPGCQSPAPVKLFDDCDQKDREGIAHAKSHTDGQKSDADDDARIVALELMTRGAFKFNYGHTGLLENYLIRKTLLKSYSPCVPCLVAV
jgi:hypothetical protein